MENYYEIIRIVRKIQLELQTVITMAQKHMQWQRLERTPTKLIVIGFGWWNYG